MNKNNEVGFLLSNNKYVKHLLIDGYDIGDLKLDGVKIYVGIDKDNKAISWIEESDKKFLGSIQYELELQEAANLLKEAIETGDFHRFQYDPKEVYDQETSEVHCLLQDTDVKYPLFYSIITSKEENLPLITGIYLIKEKKAKIVRLTEFERTVESLKMVNFINKINLLNVRILPN